MTSEKKDAWCLQIVWGESERRWKQHRRETTWNNYSSHLPSWKNSFPAAWPKRKLVNPTRIVCQIWGLTGWRPVNPFKYFRSAVICIYIYIRIIYLYCNIYLCVCGYGKAGPNVTYLGCLNLGRLRLSHYSANPVTSNDKLQSDPAIQQLSISSQLWTLHREASLRSISYLQPGAVCQRNILITYKLIT